VGLEPRRPKPAGGTRTCCSCSLLSNGSHFPARPLCRPGSRACSFCLFTHSLRCGPGVSTFLTRSGDGKVSAPAALPLLCPERLRFPTDHPLFPQGCALRAFRAGSILSAHSDSHERPGRSMPCPSQRSWRNNLAHSVSCG
jgi:hypothetical protein